ANENGEAVEGGRYRFDPETMRMLRESSGRVVEFATVGSDRDVYSEHMRVATEMLGEERYFDAEERFTRAMAVRRGDITARIGRAHAQLGAGLFLSAGVNLRNLLREHPEIASARYDARLLPAGERLGQTVIVLRQTLSEGGEISKQAAMLLAYVGFQAGQIDVAREGLDAMRASSYVDRTGATRERSPDPLAELLAEIWLPLLEGAGGGGPPR
ncbi:MAG: hypothetical protein AAGK04_01620, partial [Planctomycetota bacterium]